MGVDKAAMAAVQATAPTAPRGGAAMTPAKARAAAEEFEAVFITEMLRPMLDQVSVEPPFGGGFGEGVWKSMLADEYGRALVRQGGIGLADRVARELIEAQEAAATDAPAPLGSAPLGSAALAPTATAPAAAVTTRPTDAAPTEAAATEPLNPGS